MTEAAEVTAPAASYAFTHVRMVFSMLVSLGIARLMIGIAREIQHPDRYPVYWVHGVWRISFLLMLVGFWWWEFSLSRIAIWQIGVYLFVIVYAALMYLLCALLVPDDLDGYADARDYFIRRRRWIFGLLIAVLLMDVGDTLVKGMDHWRVYGIAYPVRIACLIAACILAMSSKSPRVHAVLAVAFLLGQIAWTVRLHSLS